LQLAIKGSITGAYSSLTPNVTPSFVLLAVQDTKLVCYVYELNKKGDVEVSKTEFTKTTPPPDVTGTGQTSNNQSLMQSLLA
jgi:vacuolar protein sorting-associated protein 29